MTRCSRPTTTLLAVVASPALILGLGATHAGAVPAEYSNAAPDHDLFVVGSSVRHYEQGSSSGREILSNNNRGGLFEYVTAYDPSQVAFGGLFTPTSGPPRFGVHIMGATDSTPYTVPGSDSGTVGVADSSGDVFSTSETEDGTWRITAVGGDGADPRVLATGQPLLGGLDVNPFTGSIFVTAPREDTLFKYVPVRDAQGQVTSLTRTVLTDDLSYPFDVEIQADGTLLVADCHSCANKNGAAASIEEVPAAGGSPTRVAALRAAGGIGIAEDGTVYGTYDTSDGGTWMLEPGATEVTDLDAGLTRPRDVAPLPALLPPSSDEPGSGEDDGPTITARASSSGPPNAAGWYSTPATVRFTCTAGAAPLATSCPSPERRRNLDGAVSGSVRDTAGRSDSVEVLMRVDTTAPRLTTRRTGRAPYAQTAKPVRCTAADALSGLAGTCRVTYSRAEGTRRAWRATVRDVAGNTTTRTGAFTVRR